MNARLIKEAMLRIHLALRNQDHLPHDIGSYSVYYCASGDPDASKLAGASIHSLDQFPHPDHRYILMADNGRPDTCPAVRVLVRAAECDPYVLSGSIFESDGQFTHNTYIAKLERVSHLDGEIDEFPKDLRAIGYCRDAEFDQESCEVFTREVLPLWSDEERWVLSFESHNFERNNHSEAAANMLLRSIAGFVVPTAYFIKMRVGQFGPPKFRAMWADKPILTVIGFDRLYRMYRPSGIAELLEITPHFRRGHTRYLWRKSGLEYPTRKLTEEERIRLALDCRVRRTYVHPCWVGERHFERAGLKCEVVTGKTELKPLGSAATEVAAG